MTMHAQAESSHAKAITSIVPHLHPYVASRSRIGNDNNLKPPELPDPQDEDNDRGTSDGDDNDDDTIMSDDTNTVVEATPLILHEVEMVEA